MCLLFAPQFIGKIPLNLLSLARSSEYAPGVCKGARYNYDHLPCPCSYGTYADSLRLRCTSIPRKSWPGPTKSETTEYVLPFLRTGLVLTSKCSSPDRARSASGIACASILMKKWSSPTKSETIRHVLSSSASRAYVDVE